TASLPMLLDRPVDPERDHIRGRVDAPLTLVEYADFECPFCARATGVMRELQDRFGCELRYVFRHLPLSDVHGHAELAALAAEAAGEQGRFWASIRTSSRSRTYSDTPASSASTWSASPAIS